MHSWSLLPSFVGITFCLLVSLIFCEGYSTDGKIQWNESDFLIRNLLTTHQLTAFDGLDTCLDGVRRSRYRNDAECWSSRAEAVVSAFQHSWRGYRDAAFGHDTVRPLSGTSHDDFGLSLTIIDSLDTMILMNLRDEYLEARQFLAQYFTSDVDKEVNTFEVTIRALGGLLSAHYLTGEGLDPLFKNLAVDLGDRLIQGAYLKPQASGVGFEVPAHTVNLKERQAAYVGYPSECSTSEVTSLQLEFKYLSKITGNTLYHRMMNATMDLMEILLSNPLRSGLAPIYMDPKTKEFVGDYLRMGSRGDSHYEYLLKQFLLTDQSEFRFLKMYEDSLNGVRKNLLMQSVPNRLSFIAELPSGLLSDLYPKMDHLVCFLPGLLALGATKGYSLEDLGYVITESEKTDMDLALDLMFTCYKMYEQMPTGLAPEIVHFEVDDSSKTILSFAERKQTERIVLTKNKTITYQYFGPDGDIYVNAPDRHNLLRPETVESLFILSRITGDAIYKEMSWNIFQSFVKHAQIKKGKSPGSVDGFTSILDVTTIPAMLSDNTETFWFSETLKYLYLTFTSSAESSADNACAILNSTARLHISGFVDRFDSPDEKWRIAPPVLCSGVLEKTKLHSSVFNTEAHLFPVFNTAT